MYFDIAKKEEDDYQAAMLKWEGAMIKDGKTNLIRQKTLKQMKGTQKRTKGKKGIRKNIVTKFRQQGATNSKKKSGNKTAEADKKTEKKGNTKQSTTKTKVSKKEE